MRLAFDLDGTVADMQSALAREARRLFPGIDPAFLPRSTAPGTGPDAADSPPAEESRLSIGHLSSRQQRELWKTVCDQENWWETLAEIEPGSLARLYRLVQDRKWELMFVTSRPETRGETAQTQSYRWLAAQGYETPSVFVVHGSRGKIAAALALDILVDDRPENCLDVALDSTARAILVWRGEEAKIPASARQLGIGSVATIAECLDILESLDRHEAEEPGMLDRLKRLLGLKSPGPRTSNRGVASAASPAAPTTR
ncbi:MAG: hypothetical protein JSU08_16040 [Acidobacteria bacterium]|nr:hypothetical protein [Acidobacteriota bacterium]